MATHGHGTQANGRFFAIPGRRGKPSGVGPSFGITSRPLRSSGGPAARHSATRARTSTSALGPTQSTAAPPGRTSGRHHSAATGGSARALATATPQRSLPCSSARPQITRRLGSSLVQPRRKSAFRRSASSSVTSRSGSEAASGIPGAPPPEPTSTIGPSSCSTTGTPRRLSSSSTRRASAGSFSEVRPGVSRTPAIQRCRRSSASADRWKGSGETGRFRRLLGTSREDDDEAIGLGPLARRLNAVGVLELEMDDLPLDRGHRLERNALAAAKHIIGRPPRHGAERGLPASSIPGCVDDRRLPRHVPREDRVHEVLDRVDRLAMTADQQPEVTAGARGDDGIVELVDVDAARDPHSERDPRDELAHERCDIALVGPRRLLHDHTVALDGGDDARRRIADSEQAALALGDDLEPNRALVETRAQALELAQRRPLRLADGLAGGLDAELLAHLAACTFLPLALDTPDLAGRLRLRLLHRGRLAPVPTLGLRRCPRRAVPRG